MRKSAMLLAAVISTTASTLLAVGQPSDVPGMTLEEAAVERGMDEASYTILGGLTHQFNTDIDGGGEFSLTRLGAGALIHYPLDNSEFTIDHNIVYEYDWYDFSGGEPWDNSHLLSYSLNINYALDEHWMFYGGPILGYSGESGADFGDSLIWGLSGGAMYQFNRELMLGLGLIVVDQIEDDTDVIPIILVDWAASDTVHVRNARPQPGLRGGAGIEVAYVFTANWEVAAGGTYDNRRFRLSNDNVGENSSLPVYVRMTWSPNSVWTVSGIVGLVFDGELKLDNSSGNRIARNDYDTAPFVGVGASYHF